PAASLRDLAFGTLGEVAAEGHLYRHAAPGALRQRFAPTRLGGGKVEHRSRSRIGDGASIGDRILSGLRGELVDEALDHKDVVHRPNAAPEGGPDAAPLMLPVSDPHVREGVWRLGSALDGVRIESLLERGRRPSRDDRGAGQLVAPGE